jgi:hypothetical protein
MNYQQELIMAEEREMQKRQGLERPFSVFVNSVNSEAEQMKVSYFGNRDRLLDLPHPFISTGSWIRAIPENGASYTAVYRIDQEAPQLLNTIQRNTADRIKSYNDAQGLYRPMVAGEIEVSSIGGGQMYAARRPVAEIRAGGIQRFADQDQLSAFDRAPLHRKALMNSKNATMLDEYRLGIVTRPKNSWEFSYPKVRNAYAAEEYLHMVNPAGQSPNNLYVRQNGHVLDAKGAVIKQSRTMIALRSREVFYANDDTSTTHEVDEKGNVFTRLATAAVEGHEIEVPAGNYKMSVGKSYVLQVTDNLEQSISKSWVTTVGTTLKMDVTGKATYKYADDLTITAKKVTQTSDDATTITATKDLTMSGMNVTVTGKGSVTISGQTTASFVGNSSTTVGSMAGITAINGSIVNIAGGGLGIARLIDQVIGTDGEGMPVIAMIVSGSFLATCG